MKRNSGKRRRKYIKLFFTSFFLVLLVGGVCLGIFCCVHLKGRQTAPVMRDTPISQDEKAIAPTEATTDEREILTGEGNSSPMIHDSTVSADGAEEKQEKVSETQEKTDGENRDKQTDCYQEKIFYRDTKVPGEAELVFGGDICFYDEFALMVSYRAREGDINKCISQDLLQEIQNGDVFMLNNEFAYSERGEPLFEKAYTFRSKPENVKILRQLGVDIVGLANNHVFDYGQQAMLDTLSVLEEEQIPYIGAGRNLEEARMPAYFDFGDFVVAYVNATQIERNESPDTKGATENSPGTFRCFNRQEFSNLQETIGLAKEKADFVVVYIHWGTENTDELDWAQTYQAPLIAEAGADLIIGNHTHCLQGLDYIGNTPVIYSTGNFWFNSKELDTCIVKAVVTKDGLKSFRFLPAKQKNCATSLLEGAEKERVLEYMRSISLNVEIDEEGYVKKR